jgi:predicted SAM-dependent methyltransferase
MSVQSKLATKYASRGLRRALRLAREELRLQRRHRRSVKKLKNAWKRKNNLKLHLGCGEILLPGWINVDLLEAGADAQFDLREDWPFENESAEYVYSEHTLEHFDFPTDVRHFLAETLRVLIPGGLTEIGVPDTAWPLAAYEDQSNEYWQLSRNLWLPPEVAAGTQLEIINYHFRLEGEHRYAWDEKTLMKELEQAGFNSIERISFDPAFHSESRRHGTLYMRARKSI